LGWCVSVRLNAKCASYAESVTNIWVANNETTYQASTGDDKDRTP
jgi:hypothetical protein